MLDKELFEELLQSIESSKGRLAIVEGINDKKALEQLGFTNIFPINRIPLYKVVDLLGKNAEVILLVDLDREGRKIYSQLKEQFLNHGVIVDDGLRELLFKTELRQIEGLPKYLERQSSAQKNITL